MTISNTSTKAVAQGNNATTVWPFDFLIPAQADLIVTLVTLASGDENVLTPSLYSVTGFGDPDGGSVTYPLSGSPLSPLYDIVVERFMPEVQETDLTNQGGAYPADIEDALDYLTMICQQLQDQIDRCVVFSVADEVEGTLPVASARANLIMAFDADGNPIAIAEIDPSVQVSAAMIPVVTAATLADARDALGITTDSAIPSGTVFDYYAGGTAPTGYVYPIGQPCTSTYPDYRAKLVAAASPFGTDGTDPLMPDLRSVVGAGKSDMGGVNNGLLPGGTVLGAVLGSATQTLTLAQIPTGITSRNATQALSVTSTVATVVQGAGSSILADNQPGATHTVITDLTQGTITSTGTADITVTSNNTGGGSHPIIQPTIICNKILKVH